MDRRIQAVCFAVGAILLGVIPEPIGFVVDSIVGALVGYFFIRRPA